MSLKHKQPSKKEIMAWGTIIAVTDAISGVVFISRDELFLGLFGLFSALVIGCLLYRSVS